MLAGCRPTGTISIAPDSVVAEGVGVADTPEVGVPPGAGVPAMGRLVGDAAASVGAGVAVMGWPVGGAAVGVGAGVAMTGRIVGGAAVGVGARGEG